MLSRASRGTVRAVDCIQWELTLESGIIQCQYPLGPDKQGKKRICRLVGEVLAEYTLAELEPRLLSIIYQQQYRLDDPNELAALIDGAVAQLNGEPSLREDGRGRSRSRRKADLAGRYAACLEQYQQIRLDGFIRFRLKDYCAELENAAAVSLEERKLDWQFRDFMALIQAFAQEQEERSQTVHVLHTGGQSFQLLDEQMRPMFEDEDESLVVSKLLAASPRRLYIHTSEPNSQVVRTIMGIFGDKASVLDNIPSH